MQKRLAIFEMVAAVVLFIGMVYCSVNTLRYADDLFVSSRESVDSYIVVVKDGRRMFEKFRPFFPRVERPLRSVSKQCASVSATCKWASDMFAKIPWKGDNLKEFPLRLARSFDGFNADLDNLAAEVRDMYDGKGHDDLCRAFDNTEMSLVKTKSTLGVINRNFCFMVSILLAIAGLLCSGMFVRAMARLKQS